MTQAHDHAAPAAEHAHSDSTHAHSDTTVIFGRTLPYPIYTVVFAVLAVLTLVEVVLSELPEGWFGSALLIIFSLIKAYLVVWYYMHLREDSKIYAAILIIPVVLVAISTLYLASVPTGNY